jgi:HPt (histidine-containing phosphotransfer) domain-containing protein
MLDEQSLWRRLGGDRQLLADLLELFREQTPALLAEIDAAVARRDSVGVKKAAHTLKGSIGSFSTGPAYATALALETAGRDADWEVVVESRPVLEPELARLVKALEQLTVPCRAAGAR